MRTPAYWREQAARARAAAQEQLDPKLHDAWIAVAIGFQEMAADLETRGTEDDD